VQGSAKELEAAEAGMDALLDAQLSAALTAEGTGKPGDIEDHGGSDLPVAAGAMDGALAGLCC
jgi:hypothetical protein